MFQNYSGKAVRAIMFARVEAGARGAEAIGAEHLLLGLFRADMDLINRFYPSDASLVSCLASLEAQATDGEKIPASVELPLSAEGERVLRYAAEEARGLACKRIGSEHLLLGLIRGADGPAARIIRECGFDASLVRRNLSAGDAAA
ncbi:MAG TPA: Clp protease N-terminal domain-containing protein [Pyrinomonadaceae bacterium]|jgi:ATP-dependent Clp protease ATP-binding subunit ClpC